MANSNNPQPIPDREIKQNAGATASMALQATQKAWDLRQAANAAGDPNAREEILAKAINKEIEAESFGKAAKYTQSGAFQGLAAGAGLGVQPGVTLGKITGAIVGGTVATVTGLLGGGIGSVYGAMSGPMWNLGEMASHGVRGVVGDFPNWTATDKQKRALEKMVLQTKETAPPTQEELERMEKEAPDDMPKTWEQSVNDVTSWRPSVPKIPEMPEMPGMESVKKGGAALGFGELNASLPSWGGGTKQTSKGKGQTPQSTTTQEQPRTGSNHASKLREVQKPKEAPKQKSKSQSVSGASEKQSNKPKASSCSEDGTAEQKTASSNTSAPSSKPPKLDTTSRNTASKHTASPAEKTDRPPVSGKKNQTPSNSAKQSKPSPVAKNEKRKPRKLATRSNNKQSTSSPESAPKKAPRKLETRRAVQDAP